MSYAALSEFMRSRGFSLPPDVEVTQKSACAPEQEQEQKQKQKQK